jgi:hypothetical protein
MASLTAPADRTQTRAALFLALAMAATVGGALGFQYAWRSASPTMRACR